MAAIDDLNRQASPAATGPAPAAAGRAAAELRSSATTDDALAASEAFARSVLEASPDCVKTLDRDGRLLTMNGPGLCLMEVDDFCLVAGADWAGFWRVGGVEAQARAAVATALAGGTARFRGFCPTAKGTGKWWDVIVAPIRGADGGVARVLSVSRDVTGEQLANAERERLLRAEREARERLALHEEQFRALFASAPMPVFLVDPRDHSLVAFNDLAAAHLGYSRAELARLRVHDFDALLSAEELRASGRAVEAGGLQQFETRHRSRGGELRDVVITVQSIDLQGRTLAYVCAMDITVRKRAEQALLAADRRKDEFLATLAHELRNPLAPLRNALQILKRSDDPAVAAGARAIMERQLGQLVRLVDDLLDVSRITSGKLKLKRERLAIRAVVEQALETARPQIEARRHRLEVEFADEPEIDGDAVRLAQVLTNLLNNAAKYSEPGGTITLAVRATAPGRVRVEVRDTGIGIAPEALEHVFDLFAQVEQGGDKAQGGLGIGLALARRLAEMHGGRLEAASDGLGRGSTFVLELPVAAPATRVDAASAGAVAVPRCRIVVADDNRDAADSLASMLRLDGHEVSTCYDGCAAIELIRACAPDVAVLDLGMPGCDGLEVARAVRRDPACAPARLIALTGWGQDDDKRRTREAGFEHHFTKPVEPEALRRALARTRDPINPSAGMQLA